LPVTRAQLAGLSPDQTAYKRTHRTQRSPAIHAPADGQSADLTAARSTRNLGSPYIAHVQTDQHQSTAFAT